MKPPTHCRKDTHRKEENPTATNLPPKKYTPKSIKTKPLLVLWWIRCQTIMRYLLIFWSIHLTAGVSDGWGEGDLFDVMLLLWFVLLIVRHRLWHQTEPSTISITW